MTLDVSGQMGNCMYAWALLDLLFGHAMERIRECMLGIFNVKFNSFDILLL